MGHVNLLLSLSPPRRWPLARANMGVANVSRLADEFASMHAADSGAIVTMRKRAYCARVTSPHYDYTGTPDLRS